MGSWPGPGPRELTQKESVSHRILYDAVERGINVIDTADVYGCAVIRRDRGVRELGGSGVGQRDRLQDRVAELQRQIDAYEALCAELGERPSDVAPACCCTNLP